jgi:hypothetical protein
MEMLRSMNMGNLPGLSVAQVSEETSRLPIFLCKRSSLVTLGITTWQRKVRADSNSFKNIFGTQLQI